MRWMALERKSAIRKDIVTLIAPILASNILEMLVGIISMALIGNLSSIAIASMGLSLRVRGLVWAVYKGVAIGAQVVVAQAYGISNDERVKKATQQTVGSVALISLAIVGTMWFFPEPFLKIFNAKAELLEMSKSLLKVVALGFPFLGTVIVISGALQGKGDAKTPLYINTIMNVLNVVIGFILVKGLFGIPAMGLMGAGWAMVLAQMIAAIIGIVVLVSRNGALGGATWRGFFKFTASEMRSIYKTGIPSVIESLFWQISSILLIRSILTYGDDALAAYQLGLQAESIAYMPAAGFQVAATAYVGKYLSAKKVKLAKAYLKEIVFWAVIVSIVGGGLLVFLPKVILGMMTPHQHLIAMGTVYLIYCGLAQVPQNVAGVLGGALRGAGYTTIPMISAGIGLYLVRIPIAFIAAYWMHWSINIIFLAIAIDMGVRLILNVCFYKK